MLLPRAQVRITENDLSPVISICSILCLIVAVLSVLGRVFTKLAVIRKLSLDDYIIFLALVQLLMFSRLTRLILPKVFFTAQTADILVAAGTGLGKHWQSLTSREQEAYEKVWSLLFWFLKNNFLLIMFSRCTHRISCSFPSISLRKYQLYLSSKTSHHTRSTIE